MSDPPRGADSPDDPDIDELPSEFTPPGASAERSLEEEIAALATLEEEGEEKKPPNRPAGGVP